MKPTFQHLFNEFVFECEFVRKLKPETLRGYREALSMFTRLIPEASTESLNAMTMAKFFKLLDERKRMVGKGTIKTGIKKSTVANYWSKLNCFFEWLKIKKLIPQNPFAEMEYPSPVFEDRKFLMKEDIEKILTAIVKNPDTNILLLKRNLVIFYILLFCGLRKGELLLLQVRDIDLDRKIVTVRAETSKIPRTRRIPLHSDLVIYLKDYLIARKKFTTPYLIVSSTRDDRFSYDGLKHLVRKLRENSGIRFHLHQLRHTFAVNFLNRGGDIAKLKQLLGHTDIRMTMVYLRCLPTSVMKSDIEKMSIDNLV